MRPTPAAFGRYALLSLLSLAATAFANAQQPATPPPAFGEQVEVNEVLLDVLVTDRDGNVIVGLRPEDFVVEEDGTAVPLLEVSFYSNRPRLDEAGRRMAGEQSDRYFVLFFHDQRRLNAEVPGVLARSLEAGRRVREWVGTLLLADWVAVVSYDTSLAVHLDFSRDRAALAAAVGQALEGRSPRGNWQSRLPPEGQPSLLRELPRGRELSRASDTIYEALTTLARAGESLVGRKNLVLLSTGFGRVNPFGQFLPEEPFNRDMIRALNDGNVAVYALDLAPAGIDLPFAGALSLLANETGGRYFQNVVNFAAPLEQLAEETNGYYLLSYRATHPRGSSGFQPVRVSVRNPELQVKARAGYLYGN